MEGIIRNKIIMEPSNVNNLNGIPNMGHGLEPAAVEPTEALNESTMDNDEIKEEVAADVPAEEGEAEANNG